MTTDPRWGDAPFGQTPRPFGVSTRGPELDMTPDGEFRSPPAVPVTAKLMALGILVAIAAGTLAVAAVALWFALMLVPVAIGAGLFAFAVYKVRQWRTGSLGGHPLAPRPPFGR